MRGAGFAGMLSGGLGSVAAASVGDTERVITGSGDTVSHGREKMTAFSRGFGMADAAERVPAEEAIRPDPAVYPAA